MDDPVTLALAEFLRDARVAGGRLWVAFSGGLDSTVLLHALARLSSTRSDLPIPELAAIHVDHRLHPASADWARHCAEVARQFRVPIRVLPADVEDCAQHGPEGAARRARYAAMQSVLRAGDWLLTAHHAEDQAETFLLRALRGAGLTGLAAMRPIRALGVATLARPLLVVTRAAIRAYAERHALDWIEDPSNADPRIDRNFLRQQVLPLLATRWPQARQAFTDSARHLRAAEFFAETELQRRLALARPAGSDGFVVAALTELPAFARPALLLTWLATTGLPLPPPKALAEILRQLEHAGAERSLQIRWAGAEVRRYRDRLYALPPSAPPESIDCVWPTALPLRLADGRGLCIEGKAPPKLFRVRSTASGDRLRIAELRPQRLPRQLFQEHGIPPWQRQRALYLYDDPDAAILAPDASNDDHDHRGPPATSGPPRSRLLAVLPWFYHPALARWLTTNAAEIRIDPATHAVDPRLGASADQRAPFEPEKQFLANDDSLLRGD